MRAVVVGIDSVIGSALRAALVAGGAEVFGTTRRIEPAAGNIQFLDLADNHLTVDLPRADTAFLCAAMTSLADCRTRPELACRVNFTGPASLAARLSERGTRVVLLSTNAVLDCLVPSMGADRPKAPTSVYGRTKAAAEDAILSPSIDGIVLRLTKVLTPDMPLLQRWIRSLRAGQPIEAIDDHRMAPLLIRHVVAALIAIAESGNPGLYQVSATHDVSYLDFGMRLADRLGAARSLVLQRSAAEMGIPEDEIMSYTSLDTASLSALTGMSAPDPYIAIDEVVSAAIAA